MLSESFFTELPGWKNNFPTKYLSFLFNKKGKVLVKEVYYLPFLY